MRRPRKVELLGGGMDCGVVPPLDPEADERWGLNNLMFARFSGDFVEWTRWFDWHPRAHIQATRPDAYAWYQRQSATRPIYLAEPDQTIAGRQVLPVSDLQRYFARNAERMFWGSLSYMLALAIFEGFEAIDVFWFPFNDRTYGGQIPSARYWMGQADARGLALTIHGDSALKATGPLYGLEAI